MSRVGLAGARRRSRVRVRPRRPAIPPARLAALNTRSMRARRSRRLSALLSLDPSRLRVTHTGHRLPLGIELLRAVVGVACAILAVLVALPALIEVAAAPFR